MPFYYTIAKSLSVESLLIIYNKKKDICNVSELYKKFASNELISERLDTMVHNGYILQKEDKYFLTRKGMFLARTFLGIKKFWKLGPGG